MFMIINQLFLLQTRRAEVKVAVAMVKHNIQFSVADHFSPLYKECFEDSPMAQSFKSVSTKTTCIINEAVAPHLKKELVMKMREIPFTLVTDGSNDTGKSLTTSSNLSLYPFLHAHAYKFQTRCKFSYARYCYRSREDESPHSENI